jgi:hypothetical protein
MSQRKKLFDKYMKKTGILIGEIQFSLIQPDYLAFEQSGSSVIIAGPRTSRFDVKGDQFQEPTLRGSMVYDIFCDRGIISPGTVFTPYVPDNQTPTFTITHFYPFKAVCGLLTDRLGQVCDGISNVLYTNLRFSWMLPERPEGGLNTEYVSIAEPRRRAIMFKRQGIGMSPPIRKGMFFQELYFDAPYTYRIDDIQTFLNYTVLNLSEAVQ